jgi:hypothetical protein
MTQQRKEGGRGGRVGIADRCHRRRRTTRRRQEGEQGSPRSGDEDDGDSEEDEAKTIAAIDVGRMNNGADNPDANKDVYDGDGDSDDDGVAMLANGTEVARRDVDATSKRGDLRWTPLHCFIVD